MSHADAVIQYQYIVMIEIWKFLKIGIFWNIIIVECTNYVDNLTPPPYLDTFTKWLLLRKIDLSTWFLQWPF